MQVAYEKLPTEVATFRDFAVLAVRFPNRGALISFLLEQLGILEDFVEENPEIRNSKVYDYWVRTRNVYDFITDYTTDDEDGKPFGFDSFP